MFTKTSSFQTTQAGKLYLVPTPIGNLSDMTPRAIETLQKVDLIAAEDTRNTARLLAHFEVSTPQISFHEHNTQMRIPKLLEKLQAGHSIAQVSDAGMPSISDPGKELVAACVQAQIPVIPLPGPNAALTALIASGLAPQPFLFYGFLPPKPKDQVKQLEELNYQKCTMIFYEAPHRIGRTLASMVQVFGAERQVVLCRELTKKYEEFLRGSLGEVQEWAQNETIRGEFVVLVEGNANPPQIQDSGLDLTLPYANQVEAVIATGISSKEAIKEVAKLNQVKKQVVYRAYHHLDEEED
ncbi:16S rRNA (cytidine(1402)-2'-O)-methyltransferase [Ligilactobacillus equi]|uniref:Ribosomal RNA small subunit methyltransferase I n=2 Tax=Ligilactobacillus equi TaxID=137357 RepID=V7HZS1_9LACO|nr:16S rRNA (cytidine(1402)-2'-O)-methyltransferase [Ligilactobacillus equi]ETA74713.1 methyltransferase [Ligilactobacillus equi DPC 6820]KRL84965.1 tetrapyrrole (Corrin Porphyrin) methylase family protein [Ligilactobacillus equi DSM 15833 = JCM 10991]MCQ2557238.1 16S rRNA (cytidine(1402)-2'-O)-methyltransferase [Ligilactobacillus sp.]